MSDHTHHLSVHVLGNERVNILRDEFQNTKKRNINGMAKIMFSQYTHQQEKIKNKHGERSNRKKNYHNEKYKEMKELVGKKKKFIMEKENL